MAVLSDPEIAKIEALGTELLARSERVLIPAGEVQLARRAPCLACRRPMAFCISFRLDGIEVAWASVCEDHQDVQIGVEVS